MGASYVCAGCGKPFKMESWLKKHEIACGALTSPKTSTKKKKGSSTELEKQDAAVQPPAFKPPVSAVGPTPPAATPPRPTEIPVGSELMLNGAVWWQDPATLAWAQATAVETRVRVSGREVQEAAAVVFLMCRGEGSEVLWSVEESRILAGEMEILHLPSGAVPAPSPVMPPSGKSAVTEEEDAKAAVIAAYRESAEKFVSAKEAKAKAESKMKMADKKHRPIIEQFARDFGAESDTGKMDFKIVEYGYSNHLVRVAGKSTIKRDENAIVEWCLKSGHSEALKQCLNVEVWEALKNAGIVPQEFISAVEEPVEGKDRFSLYFKRADEDAE